MPGDKKKDLMEELRRRGAIIPGQTTDMTDDEIQEQLQLGGKESLDQDLDRREDEMSEKRGPGFGERLGDALTDSRTLEALSESLKSIGAPVRLPQVRLNPVNRTSPQDIMAARRNALMQMVRRGR